MLSTRSMYNSDTDFYRRSDRGVPMALGQDSSIPDQYEPTQSSQRQTPGTEHVSKPPVSHRKRVPVACERCRKRKIKCSGDEGGGRGCFNCRSAGHAGCQFLRVQSFNASVTTSTIPSGRSWQMSRWQPYSLNGHQRSVNHSQSSQHQTQNNPLAYNIWQSGLEFTGYPTNSSTTWSRVSYPSTYPLSYESEATSLYSNPLPSYMLPDPETGPHANVAYMQPMNRPSQDGVWMNQINTIPVTQSAMSSVPSSYTLNTSETSPMYQPLNNGSASLHRTLPDPASSRHISTLSNTSGDTPPLSALSHPSSIGWQTETASNTSVTSSHTSCSDRHDPTSSYTAPPYSTQDIPLECSASTNSPQSTIPVCTLPSSNDAFDFHPLSLPSSARYSTMRRAAYVQRDHTQSPATAACNVYGYTSVSLQNRRVNQEYPSRSLINGSTYWPVSRTHAQAYSALSSSINKDASAETNEGGEIHESCRRGTLQRVSSSSTSSSMNAQNHHSYQQQQQSKTQQPF